MPALIAAVFVMFFTLSVTSVAADDDGGEKIKSYVDEIGNQVMEILTGDNGDREEKRIRLEELFRKTVDIDWIAKFVLPRHWRTLSEEQRQEYLTYYRRQFIDNYVSKFEEYKEGTRFKVLRAIPEMENEYLVAMKIFRPNAPAIMAEYRVRDYGDNRGFKVFDIIVEGASLISAQRSEYTSIANSRGVDYLIAQLAAKVKAAEAARSGDSNSDEGALHDSASNNPDENVKKQ